MRNYKNNYSFELKLPLVFIKECDHTEVFSSMILSTISTVFFIMFVPWAVPLLMASIQDTLP